MRNPFDLPCCRTLRWPIAFSLLVAVPSLPSVLAAQEDDDEIVELSPFVVSTDGDLGYLSTNSTSGTSLNIAIKDLPMAVQVINQDQITDLGASNLEEALLYSAGVFTSDNESSRTVGATRGTQGGGSGDKSISSAGQGSRFANLVYIRGLSTPYQNRMGFRYGGLVVTPDSAIALGGLMDSANIERIEVVKGPNSLLYGVGVLTGIVNVIPERPLPEPRYEISYKLGSYDFQRFQADFTGPVGSDWIPGELNWRLAGSWEEKGNWTDFRSDKTDYWVAQLEYAPTTWAKLFLEYQDGTTRAEGIGSQWIYDEVNSAKNTEFRNAYDEAYAWARYDGTLSTLRQLDSSVDGDGNRTGIATVNVINNTTGQTSAQGALRLLDTAFTGGGLPNSYRITGPDTFAERDEQNFIADLELTPMENLTINVGAFFSRQETEELTLQFNSAEVQAVNLFDLNLDNDSQLNAIYSSGGIYATAMPDAIKDFYGLDLMVDPAQEGDWVLPLLTDDVKLTEYWWRHSIVKSESQQFRLRGTYTFEADLFGAPSKHTFLAGFSYIKDDIDFPDGSINRGNALANRTGDYSGTLINGTNEPSRVIENPYDNDGLYYRSIANFEPIYLDGRNDGVDGHNVVRAGDAFLNQVIEQSGLYGVYQGQFFHNKVNIILGARQDTYNATQKTYKRADVTDEFLEERALAALELEAAGIAAGIGGTAAEQEALAAAIVADRTATGTYINAWYRDSFESGDEGYYGYANRGGAPDETYGIVPGSQFDVFEKDVKVTTGTFGINYALTPNMTLYGVVAQGISPNTALRDGAGEIIPAEETLNKEIGLKFDFYNGKVSGNIAFFQIDRENAIWDVDLAPAAAKWLDAQVSANRSNEWTSPTYDPETPTTYFVRSDYFVNYLAEAFDIDPDKLEFTQEGSQIKQSVDARDYMPAGLTRPEQVAFIQEFNSKLLFPETFATQWNGQAPLGGAITINVVGLQADGLDELQDITLLNPDTGEFVTLPVSNLNILYAAFMDREIDKTKNELLRDIHPIRYRRFTSFGQPQDNNNLSFNEAQGALVTFDETIEGVELELFLTPTDNLQFVINYTHVEREADNSFNFTDWSPITGVDMEFSGPFSMLHREYGWESAGIRAAWVDADAYASALAGGDGTVAATDLGDALEMIEAGMVDEQISASEFAARNAAGELLLFVDKRGNIINEANDVLATDYEDLLAGVSLNFNPEDELSIWSRYQFTAEHGFLDGLSISAGFKYIGPSKTSISFNSISPLNELTTTPEVGERLRFDLGASYKFEWQKVTWRLSLNIYDVFEDTYDVTTTTLITPNPITGETVTKRTEKFYSPTTFRVGLSAAF